MEKIIKEIARKHGVSPNQVKLQMQLAIRHAMLNQNTSDYAKNFWKKLSPDGKEPSVEKFCKAVSALVNR